MKVRYLIAASDELEEAGLWYDRQREGLGDDLLEAVRQKVSEIVSMPERFAIVPQIARSKNIRAASLAKFPYSVIYQLHPESISILAVAHQHRRPLYWRSRSLPE